MEDRRQQKVTLKTVAHSLGLAPGTVSAVLNKTPAADRIPQATQDRIMAAVRRLDYRPNPLARALRTGHSVSAKAAASHTTRALVILDAEHLSLALDAIRKAGLRVPDDVSVVAVDAHSGEADRELRI